MQKKYILIAALIGLLIFSGIAAAWVLTRPKAYVEVHVAPTEATVTINGSSRDITSGETIRLAPGAHTLTISAEEFEDSQRSVILDEDETEKVFVQLTPINDSAKEKLNNDEARQIAAQAKALERERFLAMLPLESRDFSIISVPALMHPGTDKRDILINEKNNGGEAAAWIMIESLGFEFEKSDVLVGEYNKHIIARKSNFELMAMFDASSPKEPLIYITPINTPYVPRNENSPELEAVRRDALAELVRLGFDTDAYDIYYNDTYLSKYSPTVHDHATHG